MATQPVIYATGPYNDKERKIVVPCTLLRGQEQGLLSQAIPALERGDLVLDLRETEQMDAAGLGALAMLHEFARKQGHALHLANPREHVWNLLRLTKLDAVFSIE